MNSEIVSILDGLTDLEKNIIILRYGLVHKSLDCPQTAKVLNLEWNDVIKIENQTLKKLKENSNINLLYELIQQRDK